MEASLRVADVRRLQTLRRARDRRVVNRALQLWKNGRRSFGYCQFLSPFRFARDDQQIGVVVHLIHDTCTEKHNAFDIWSSVISVLSSVG